MNTHLKPARILLTLDGPYRMDPYGHWIPIEEEDDSYPYPGLIITGLIALSWVLIGGIGYCLYQAVQALQG